MPEEINESTMKWKVDIGQLKTAMQDAKRSISFASAEFKTATASMDNWSVSATGLEAKIKQLNSILPEQKNILNLLIRQYEITAENMGENSAEAQRLRTNIEKQRAEIIRTESSINKFNGQLTALQTSETSLTNIISRQESELSSLKREYVDVAGAQGKNSAEARALAQQISNLSSELVKNKKTASEARSEADRLDQTIEEVGESSDQTTTEVAELSEGFTIFKGIVANLASQAIQSLIGAVKQLGQELYKTGRQAVMSYADYEQLVGGVETIFGAGGNSLEEYAKMTGKSVDEVETEYHRLVEAQDTVMENAKKAFETAGVSTNAYMQQVTSFSSSLIQSLDGDTLEASRLADQAIIDMADNANKMGTAMGSIQNAYQGFAKQNYTMLDNLKLGYGGNKTEMQRLILDAEKLDETFHASREGNKKLSMSYADIIKAIHIVQENLHITGTTAKEASTTITGSMNQAKASWQNLLTGIADDTADYEQLVSEFSRSALTFASNILPRITMTITGLGNVISSLVSELLPEVTKQVPQILSEMVPALADTIVQIALAVQTLIPELQSLIPIFLDQFQKNLPVVAEAGASIVLELIKGLIIAFPKVLTAVLQAIPAVVGVIGSAVPEIVSMIPVLIKQVVESIFTNLPTIILSVLSAVKQIADSILHDGLPVFVSMLPSLVSTIVDAFVTLLPQIFELGSEITESILSGIQVTLPVLLRSLPAVIETIVKGLATALPMILQAGTDITLMLLDGLISVLSSQTFLDSIVQIIDVIINVLADNLPLILHAGTKITLALIEGINDRLDDLIPVILKLILTIVGAVIKNLPKILQLGISLVGEFVYGIIGSLGSVMHAGEEIVNGVWNALKDLPDQIYEIGKDVVEGLWEGIKGATGWLSEHIGGWVSDVVETFKSKLGIGSPSKVFAEEIGKWLPEGMALGFERDMPVALNEMRKSLDGALGSLKTDVALQSQGMFSGSFGSGNGAGSKQQTINFNQTINSPKAVDGMTLYRETSGLLFSAKVRMGNV